MAGKNQSFTEAALLVVEFMNSNEKSKTDAARVAILLLGELLDNADQFIKEKGFDPDTAMRKRNFEQLVQFAALVRRMD